MPSTIFNPLLSCLGIRTKRTTQSVIEHISYETKYTDEPRVADDTAAAADKFVLTLLTANSSRSELCEELKSTVHTTSWTESLATAILSRLEDALKNGAELGKTVKDALEQTLREAAEFAKDHPAFMTLIGLGILALIAPYVLAWLGFGEIGIVEGKYTVPQAQDDHSLLDNLANICAGSFAALWQARYAGYVPKGSLFSFFQRLGMIWKWKI